MVDIDLPTLIGIISIIVAVVGSLIGIYLAWRPIQKPLFLKETVKIIDPDTINPVMGMLNQSDPNLRITYTEEPITTLSSTYVTFWNAGKLRIDRDDIPSNTPLIVSSKEGTKIYRFTILSIKPENAFKIVPCLSKATNNRANCISFEYLAKDEGMKFQVIHTGKSNDDIVFQGKTKDFGDFVNVTNRDNNINKLMAVFVSAFGLYSIILIFYLYSVMVPILTPYNLQYSIIGALITTVILLIGFFLSLVIAIKVYIFILDYLYPPIPKYLQ